MGSFGLGTSGRYNMSVLVGRSRWAHQMREAIARTALTDSTVLIRGPTGTGKELIARLLHEQSCRAHKPLVAVDCPAIPPTLFASQLFGHVRGAFSGAERDALGFFRAAHGSDIFFDEIGELPGELQAQLLRVIEQRAVTPLGGFYEVPVNVRIIAATSRDLEAEVAAGRFRPDLYYRLKVVELRTIPLCQRPEDVEPLCCYFLDELARTHPVPAKRISPAALRVLERRRWPGNVRQLRNVVERALVFCDGGEISEQAICNLLELEDGCDLGLRAQLHPTAGEIADVTHRLRLKRACAAQTPLAQLLGPQSPLAATASQCAPNTASEGHWPTWAEFERQFIEATLRQAGYNQTAAARTLGIDRRMLARKMHRYGINVPHSGFRFRAA